MKSLGEDGKPVPAAEGAVPEDLSKPADLEVTELVGDVADREWSDSVMSQDFADSVQSALDDLFAETGPGTL